MCVCSSKVNAHPSDHNVSTTARSSHKKAAPLARKRSFVEAVNMQIKGQFRGFCLDFKDAFILFPVSSFQSKEGLFHHPGRASSVCTARYLFQRFISFCHQIFVVALLAQVGRVRFLTLLHHHRCKLPDMAFSVHLLSHQNVGFRGMQIALGTKLISSASS